MSAYTLSGIADILENGYPPKTAAAHLRDIIKEIASSAPQAAPEGWQLVPKVPTDEMLNAANKAETRHVINERRRGGDDTQLGWGAAYSAMLAAAPSTQPVPAHVEPMPMQKRVAELIEQHGSLRAAARVIQIDAGYLSRLANGEKGEPSDLFLRRMGLRKVVTYVQTITQQANKGSVEPTTGEKK